MYYDAEKNVMFDVETGALIPLAEGEVFAIIETVIIERYIGYIDVLTRKVLTLFFLMFRG